MKMQNKRNKSRRKFLQSSGIIGVSTLLGVQAFPLSSCSKKKESSQTIKVLTPEGKLMEVEADQLQEIHHHKPVSNKESRKGIPGKKFVMVVDLAKCKNARECVKACEAHHNLPPDRPFIKVLKIQDNPHSSPYWMPKKCFQCDNPPCVKVCPVGATFKRSDGIVLIDNQLCIGCRFCMAACPYSARVFNWGKPKPIGNSKHAHYSPETSTPSQVGTVEKCDFCPDHLREGKLPPCITACPNGVLYFGDANEDAVTNGVDTVRLSKLLKDKAGYRYLEELGTEPNVYYLPPVDRLFPFKE
ncbi:4Fe-4S dicluster domain-containing protein [Marinifilum fragile]|uniref:4Fe-4S dicluster domain-containing protein n=1 Tax=Marinifilum fragile TaxID=570161 RepID=UPI002AA60BD9|nr:4Fe-4S dicluster domain-containing protein [Marinifilum fragile]